MRTPVSRRALLTWAAWLAVAGCAPTPPPLPVKPAEVEPSEFSWARAAAEKFLEELTNCSPVTEHVVPGLDVKPLPVGPNLARYTATLGRQTLAPGGTVSFDGYMVAQDGAGGETARRDFRLTVTRQGPREWKVSAFELAGS
jgi:hypothetical protein